MTKQRPAEELKPTGVRWLESIPRQWDLVRFKSLFSERSERNGLDDAHLTPSQKYGVLPQEEYMERTGSRVVLNLMAPDNMKHVEVGDFISHLRSFQGGLERSELPGKVSAAYTVLRPKTDVHGPFFRYLMKSDRYIQALRVTTDQLRDGQSIRFRELDKIMMPVPQMREQKIIADFLDRETTKIDMLIDKQRSLIAGLRERRISAIGQRLAPGPTSASGWRRLPLKRTLKFQEGPGILASEFRDEGVPLLRISGVRGSQVTLDGCNYVDPETVATRWKHFGVKVGDLIISASASMGTISEVTDTKIEGAIPYTGLIRIEPGDMVKEFARWFFVSPDFMRQVDLLKAGSTMQHFGPSHLAQMSVWLPDRPTQFQIAAELNDEIKQMDILRTKSERLIELSQERRSALITAAVTGQINVRKWESSEQAA